MTSANLSSANKRKSRGCLPRMLVPVALGVVLLLSVVSPTTTEAMHSPLGIAAVRVRGGSSSSSSDDSNNGGGMILRVRLIDGSIEKVQLETGSEETLTLGDVLKPLLGGKGLPEGSSVRIGARTSKAHRAESSTLRDLSAKHGSLITVLPPPGKTEDKAPRFVSRSKPKRGSGRDWDPYPDLAKDHDAAIRQARNQKSSRSGGSYTALSKLRSTLHTVEPQKEGPLARLYMCQKSAERFYSNGVVAPKGKGRAGHESRCGLLLGTVSRERVDRRPRKARTSLSSQTADEAFCTVAKVQAVWEPPGQTTKKARGLPSGKAKAKTDEPDPKLYDASIAADMLTANPRVLVLAKYLGLVPVGWIFSYRDDRLDETNSFETDGPQALFGLDVAVAGTLQASAMKDKHDARQNRDETDESENNNDDDDNDEISDGFVTLAMDATTGSTEVFQLSDVAVQMAYEGLFEAVLLPKDRAAAASSSSSAATTNPPKVPTKHPVVVDGRETSELDSVLCLINTALFSHSGGYSGSTGNSATKKSNGGLTNKTKKRLVKALQQDPSEGSESSDLWEALCDFNVLLALDELLRATTATTTTEADDDVTKALCKLVKKWARGQKKGTVLDRRLKRKLLALLS